MSNQFEPVRVTVNGQPRVVVPGETLLGLVEKLDLKPDRLAIELNRRIVKPVHWAQTEIHDGAEVEIVQFVGGG